MSLEPVTSSSGRVADPRLNPRGRAVIEKKLEGLKKAAICKALKLAPKSYEKIVQAPAFRAAYQERLRERERATDLAAVSNTVVAKDIIDRASPAAARKIVQLSESAESEKVQLAASLSVLDRALPTDDGNRAGSIQMDAEGLKALAAVIREASQVKQIEVVSVQTVAPVTPAQE